MCAQATFGSPIKKMYGETVSLTTTAAHLNYRPTYHEVLLYCPTKWRMSLTPKLASVLKFAGTTFTADYTAEALDRDDTTDVILDAMAATDWLYLGVTEPVRGFYFDMDASNVNSEAADLDWEYCYDVSAPGYLKLTGTVSGALTVGETVTGQTSSATATFVYDDGSTYIIVKDNAGGSFQIGEDVDGLSQTCDNLTAIVEDTGTGFFLNVDGDYDGTKNTQTLDQDGLYRFDLPAVVRGRVVALSQQQLYWYRFAPTIPLSAGVQVNQIVAANEDTDYGYFEAGVNYQFSLNIAQTGGFEFDHLASDTLNITWIMH